MTRLNNHILNPTVIFKNRTSFKTDMTRLYYHVLTLAVILKNHASINWTCQDYTVSSSTLGSCNILNPTVKVWDHEMISAKTTRFYNRISK